MPTLLDHGSSWFSAVLYKLDPRPVPDRRYYAELRGSLPSDWGSPVSYSPSLWSAKEERHKGKGETKGHKKGKENKVVPKEGPAPSLPSSPARSRKGGSATV